MGSYALQFCAGCSGVFCEHYRNKVLWLIVGFFRERCIKDRRDGFKAGCGLGCRLRPWQCNRGHCALQWQSCWQCFLNCLLQQKQQRVQLRVTDHWRQYVWVSNANCKGCHGNCQLSWGRNEGSTQNYRNGTCIFQQLPPWKWEQLFLTCM